MSESQARCEALPKRRQVAGILDSQMPDQRFNIARFRGTLTFMPKLLKHRSRSSGFTPPDRLRPFLNEWGLVEFAVRHVRVTPGDYLRMLVGDEWIDGRFQVCPNPAAPQLSVAEDQAYPITDESKLSAPIEGRSAPLQLLNPRPHFVHPRCSVVGIRFMLNQKPLRDNEPVEIEFEGAWRAGSIRLPATPQEYLRCAMAEPSLVLITCHTRVRRPR